MSAAVKTDNEILESRIRQFFSDMAQYYTYLSKKAMAAAHLMEVLRLMIVIAGLMLINEAVHGYGAFYGQDNLAEMIPDPKQWVLMDMYYGMVFFASLTACGSVFRSSSEALLKALRNPNDGTRKSSVNIGVLITSVSWIAICMAVYYSLISSLGYPATVLLAVCILIDGSILLHHTEASDDIRKSAMFKERAETFAVTQMVRDEIDRNGSYTDYIDNQKYVFTTDDLSKPLGEEINASDSNNKEKE